MANREMFIMFVYDTQRCKREEDDPQEAVLYFHPGWVSDQQRLALCGQLMGATQFFITSFSCPHIVALNSGKFVIRQFGRYILTIGTDRNIPDWVLEHRADTLNRLIQFYHKDLETVFLNVGSDPNQFNNKLNQMFETYIPILPYAANMFGNIPMIKLPKSASNIFLEALQILHSCIIKNGVLGGTVLFQNKVVATQLSSALTKRLVSSDPVRIKSPAESVCIPFHLPVGVQLIQVYVENKEYSKLQQISASARSSYEHVASKKMAQKKVPSGKPPPPKEPISAMKRDISRIFTVPEEKEGETEQAEEFVLPKEENNIVNVLPNETHNDLPSEIASILPSETSCVFPHSTSFSKDLDTFLFTGSECPTPMREININKVLHEKVMSICSKSKNDEAETPVLKRPNKLELSEKVRNIINREIRPSEKQKRKKSKTNFLTNYNDSEIRSSKSLNDLQQNSKLTSNRVPMRYYSFGLPRVTSDMTEDYSDSSPVRNVPRGKHFYNTITDPLHPVFRQDGLPISRSLYNEQLARHYQLLDLERSNESSPGEDLSKISFTDVVLKSEDIIESKIELGIENGVEKLEKSDKIEASESEVSTSTERKENAQEPDNIGVIPSKQEVYRRSLSLPLKTMTSDYDDEETRRRSTSYTGGVLESPAMRPRTLGGLQLTPLMSKLSLIAMEDKTSGFCSRDTTPGEFRDLSFPSMSYSSNLDHVKRKTEVEKRDVEEEQEGNGDDSEIPKSAELYLFGQQNMSLILLLEEGMGQDPDLIHYLWETSVSSLNKLEMHLRQCLEHFPQTEGVDSYSYLCVDPSWDMLQRGGSWASSELEVVACIHNDFVCQPSLTEVVVRCEESTVYGYQCGKTQVFYQQPTGNTVGLPTPSDLMGLVPLKARRRLERDHGIILL